MAPLQDGCSTLSVEAEKNIDVRPILARAIVEKEWELLELRSIDVSLEDVFLDLITDETIEARVEDNAMGKEVA